MKGLIGQRPGSDPGSRGPILWFVGVFAILAGGYYFFSATRFFDPLFFRSWQQWNARIGAVLIRCLGGDVQCSRATIFSPMASLTISRGCDAVDPAALFTAGLLAFPIAWRWKLCGIIAGVTVLQVLNQVRIVTLYYALIYCPWAFDTLHHDIWQGMFVFLAAILWAAWILRATRGRTVKNHAAV